MKKLVLAAVLSQAGLAQACETPSPETLSNTVSLTCQSEVVTKDVGLETVAAEFCEELRIAIEDKLGKSVTLSDKAQSGWVVSVRMKRDRADAAILNSVSGHQEDIRFDIMGVTLTTPRIRPLVASIVAFIEP